MSHSRSLVVLSMVVAVVTIVGCAQQAGGNRAERQDQLDRNQPAQVIELAVTSEGFVPSVVKVRAGQPVRLIVTRKTDRTCATDIVIKDFQIKESLPLNHAVEVSFTPTRPGTIRYACTMDMIAGTVVVE
jgi:plastocyanin domain-containing protein